MKAITLSAPYRVDMLEREDPVAIPGQPLIAIRAAGICGSDVNSYKGKGQVLDLPIILGHEAAGVVIDTVGESRYRPGDEVIIEPYIYCGECYPCSLGQRNCCESLKCLGVHSDGTMAEYITHPEDLLHLKPKEMPWAHAAFVEPLTIATHGVHRVKAKEGEHAVVIGAGTIGILTALYLRHIGVVPIIVDMIPQRLETARRLGIERTILSHGKAPIEEIKALTGGRMAECVFDISGSVSGVESTVHLTSYAGRISLTGWPSENPCIETPLITRKELIVYGSRNSAGEFREAIDLINSGVIDAAEIITEIVPFDGLPRRIEAIAQDPSWILKVIGLLQAGE
jgi:threonine dehydrogenase-like Zn-dependent dehydrogenase